MGDLILNILDQMYHTSTLKLYHWIIDDLFNRIKQNSYHYGIQKSLVQEMKVNLENLLTKKIYSIKSNLSPTSISKRLNSEYSPTTISSGNSQELYRSILERRLQCYKYAVFATSTQFTSIPEERVIERSYAYTWCCRYVQAVEKLQIQIHKLANLQSIEKTKRHRSIFFDVLSISKLIYGLMFSSESKLNVIIFKRSKYKLKIDTNLGILKKNTRIEQFATKDYEDLSSWSNLENEESYMESQSDNNRNLSKRLPNHINCFYGKVQRRSFDGIIRWKNTLKNGIVYINNQEYFFNDAIAILFLNKNNK